MEELLEAAKALLEDYDLWGSPVPQSKIARLRRAVEKARPTSVAADLGVERCPKCEHVTDNGYCPQCRTVYAPSR
jgi:hypothetical protein